MSNLKISPFLFTDLKYPYIETKCNPLTESIVKWFNNFPEDTRLLTYHSIRSL